MSTERQRSTGNGLADVLLRNRNQGLLERLESSAPDGLRVLKDLTLPGEHRIEASEIIPSPQDDSIYVVEIVYLDTRGEDSSLRFYIQNQKFHHAPISDQNKAGLLSSKTPPFHLALDLTALRLTTPDNRDEMERMILCSAIPLETPASDTSADAKNLRMHIEGQKNVSMNLSRIRTALKGCLLITALGALGAAAVCAGTVKGCSDLLSDDAQSTEVTDGEDQ